jgi:hypothetical protein
MIQPLIRSNFDFAQLEQMAKVAVDAEMEAIDFGAIRLDWKVLSAYWKPQRSNLWIEQPLPKF